MSTEMLLLGAGASVEAGIPDAKTMARRIVKKFEDERRLKGEADVLTFVNAQLIADAQRRAGDPSIDCVDVEALYNAILLLFERDELEISPFVQEWLPKLATISKDVLESIMLRIEMMLEELTLIKDEARVQYLGPILNLARRQDRLFIATLNYDNGIELLSRAKGMPCDTAIEEWKKTGILHYPNDGINLIKLHGSVYWLWSKDARTYDKRLPHRLIRTKSHFDEKLPLTVLVETPMVIFGQHNKLTAEGPFLDLLKRFDEQLQNSDLLTVVGYSFRDSHINFYISKFLNQYGGKIRIVDPGFKGSNVDYIEHLREFSTMRPNQIDIVEKYAGDALKVLYP